VLQARSQANLLLLLPPVTIFLGWTYLVNDQKISAIGKYVYTDIGARLRSECGGAEVFGWEVVHRSDPHRITRKYVQLIVDLALFCAVPVVAVVIYYINGPINVPFVLVSILEFLATLGLAQQIILYADLKRGAHA
jgi:hypothetical protein